jgi:integrase
MRGHVRRRGDGWVYVIDIGRSEDGKRLQKWVGGFTTKKEAERELARVIRDLDTGKDPFPEKITLRAYLERWGAHQENRLRPRTLTRYRQLLTADVLPIIGDVTLDRLRPAHIQAVLTALEARGVAPATVVQARAVLSSSLRSAVAWGLLPLNPVTAVRPPKRERPKLVVPTGEQLIALVSAAKGTR